MPTFASALELQMLRFRSAIVSRILSLQNGSDAVARQQGQERFYVGTYRKSFVLNEEDFLHFRDSSMRLMRQPLNGVLLLGKDSRVHRVVNHDRYFA